MQRCFTNLFIRVLQRRCERRHRSWVGFALSALSRSSAVRASFVLRIQGGVDRRLEIEMAERRMDASRRRGDHAGWDAALDAGVHARLNTRLDGGLNGRLRNRAGRFCRALRKALPSGTRRGSRRRLWRGLRSLGRIGLLRCRDGSLCFGGRADLPRLQRGQRNDRQRKDCGRRAGAQPRDRKSVV